MKHRMLRTPFTQPYQLSAVISAASSEAELSWVTSSCYPTMVSPDRTQIQEEGVPGPAGECGVRQAKEMRDKQFNSQRWLIFFVGKIAL